MSTTKTPPNRKDLALTSVQVLIIHGIIGSFIESIEKHKGDEPLDKSESSFKNTLHDVMYALEYAIDDMDLSDDLKEKLNYQPLNV